MNVAIRNGYTFWQMTGRDYIRNYDKNFACDLDSRVYLGMNNRILVSAYESDPSDWGYQITIYDSSESYVLGYICDSGYDSTVAAIDAAIAAHESGDTTNFVAA